MAISRGTFLAVVAYAALGLYAMEPLVARMLDGELYATDSALSAWSLWWVLEQLPRLENPWFTDDLFAPDGTRLAFHALTPLLGVVSMPLTALLGPGPTVNLLSLAAPVVGALGALRLAQRVGLGTFPAFAAGALFGFSPIFLGRTAVHVNFSWTLALMPFALLAAWRLWESRRTAHAVRLGLVTGAVALVDPLGALLTAMLLGLFGLGVLVRSRGTTRPALGLVGVAVAVAIVVASPQLYSSVEATRAGDNETNRAALAPSYRTFGTDLLAIARPNPAAHVPEGVRERMEATFSTALDTPATPGLVALVLAVIGLVAARRRRVVQWSAFVFVVAVAFAVGPRLAVGEHPLAGTDQFLGAGVTPLPIEHHGVELSAIAPFTWFVQIPGFADFRVAQRFVMLFTLPVALLAGFGLRALLRSGRRWVHGAAAALLVLAVLETGQQGELDATAPYERPAVYGPIAADHSDSIVVDVPLGWVTAINTAGARGYVIEPVLRATEHGHPIAYGFTNRLSDERFARLGSHPFYAGLMYEQYGGRIAWPTPAPPPPPSPAAARADRERLGVGWAVVWPDPEVSPGVTRYLEATGFRRHPAAGGFVVYRAA